MLRSVYETIVLLSGVAFLIWSAIGPRGFGGRVSSIFVTLVALSPLYYLYILWKTPRRIILADSAISAYPWLGPNRSWDPRSLGLRDETVWSRLWGVREVVDRRGDLQFLISRSLRGYAELCSRLKSANTNASGEDV
jgi:hypothetical protein